VDDGHFLIGRSITARGLRPAEAVWSAHSAHTMQKAFRETPRRRSPRLPPRDIGALTPTTPSIVV
jgi:hypothetical protein